MNKKLLAVAVAAAMAVPAVNANADTGNVTVYGKLHVSIDSVSSDGAGYDGQAITSRASRLGFKGSEKLGNGLKAVWKMEFGTNLTEDTTTNTTINAGIGGTDTTVTSKNGITSRDHYLGLAGDWGTALLAGNINTPYKNSTGKMDFFGDTVADYNNTVGFNDVRADNAIVYISPKFNGLQFAGALVAGENAATNKTGLADAYSFAVTYAGNGLMLAAAYEDLSDLSATLPIVTNTKWRVGGMYAMNAFKVAAVYENQDKGAPNSIDRFQVSGAYTMGNNTVKAMYGQEDTGGTASSTDAYALGLDHKFSKRTTVYGMYTDSERGLRTESNQSLYGGPGSAFSVGMIHKF